MIQYFILTAGLENTNGDVGLEIYEVPWTGSVLTLNAEDLKKICTRLKLFPYVSWSAALTTRDTVLSWLMPSSKIHDEWDFRSVLALSHCNKIKVNIFHSAMNVFSSCCVIKRWFTRRAALLLYMERKKRNGKKERKKSLSKVKVSSVRDKTIFFHCIWRDWNNYNSLFLLCTGARFSKTEKERWLLPVPSDKILLNLIFFSYLKSFNSAFNYDKMSHIFLLK